MESHLDIFNENGYLVVPDALNADDLAPLVNIIDEVVDKRAQKLYKDGTISDVYKDSPFERRWYAVLQECGRENEVFGWHTLVYSAALFNLITNSKVLDMLNRSLETRYNSTVIFGCVQNYLTKNLLPFLGTKTVPTCQTPNTICILPYGYR